MTSKSYKFNTLIITVLGLITIQGNGANADTNPKSGTLAYNNRAYIYPISGAPNPAPEVKVKDAKIIYVTQAYGPAIYSYKPQAPNKEIAFNVEYVNNAYGPAIYSYPYNNTNPQYQAEHMK